MVLAVNSPSPASASPTIDGQNPVWQRLLRETRTRILLLYTLLMLLLTGLAIPVFRYLLFQEVEKRVRIDLNEEREAFLADYRDWEKTPDQTIDGLKDFVDQYLRGKLPEDDNFHLVLIDGELYRSNPVYLLPPIRPDSELFNRWRQVRAFTRGEEFVADSEIGSIVFKAEPLMLDGKPRGVYVVAHASAGERQESLAGVYLFMQMIATVLLLSLALSWIGAGKLMAPIRSLSKTARAISEANLTQRIPPIHGNGELAELANTFNIMMNRIQQAFESQRSFINDAGHELRTPITIIQGHLELLDDDPQERQETLELVIDELDRMGRLVNDMMLLAKAERADFLQLETIEVSTFTEALFTKAKALGKRDWVLTVQAQGKMVGDRQQLTGALLNLLRNAMQHTQASDTIELGCCLEPQRLSQGDSQTLSQGNSQTLLQRGPQVRFWVRDTGEGISAADQQRIFSRFSRGASGQQRSDGSGLGLAIVSAIAAAHKGKVSVVSQVGGGAIFWLTLPMEQSL